MEKLLFLADLHGNMPATLALQKEIERIKPDDIWFLGDAVGKGPESDKTLEWVRKYCHHHIAGNWDQYIVNTCKTHSRNMFSFYWNQFNDEQIEWIDNLPLEDEVLISGFNFRLIHGRPVDRNFKADLSRAELEEGFVDTKGKLHNGLISADCHVPYIRETKHGYAINTGSVGNSLGIPNCHALLIEGKLNCEEKSPIYMTTLSIPYDNNKAAEIAKACPDLNAGDCYIKEVLTGRYAPRHS